MERSKLKSYLSPDRSKSDFFCPTCDSHMNSVQMWESHISGKRHIKNVNKKPYEPPSKIKTITCPASRSYLDRLLEDVDEPVVGVNYICELQRSNANLDPTYTCYLCHGTFLTSTIVDHLLLTKHRLNYLKEVDGIAFSVIENMKLKKYALDDFAIGEASRLELKDGRGHAEVKLEKPKFTLVPSAKRRFDQKVADHFAPSTITHDPGSPGSHDSEPPSTLHMPQGIEDIDVIRDVKHMSMDMKIAILEDIIVNNPPPVETEEDSAVVVNVIKLLNTMLMQGKVRNYPPHVQQKLFRDIMKPDPKQYYAGILGFVPT